MRILPRRFGGALTSKGAAKRKSAGRLPETELEDRGGNGGGGGEKGREVVREGVR